MSGLRTPGTYAGERLALDALGCLLAAAVLGGVGFLWLLLWGRFHR